MDFTEATDRLTRCPTLETLADELGASYGVLRQARMDPSSRGYRNPPSGWEQAIAKLAWRRASELAALAAGLAHPGSAKVRDAMEKLADQLERVPDK